MARGGGARRRSSPRRRRRRRPRRRRSQPRRATMWICGCPSRAPAWPGACSLDTRTTIRAERRTALADRQRARRPLDAHPRRRSRRRRPQRGAARRADAIDALAEGRRHRRRLVGRRRQAECRVAGDQDRAADGACALPAATQAQALREPRPCRRRDAAAPRSGVARPLRRRSAARGAAARASRQSRASATHRKRGRPRRRLAHRGGRERAPRARRTGARSPSAPSPLPALPIGRHRLIVDGVACALTVAPPEAYRAKAALRRRFGVGGAALRPAPRDGDQGIGDFTTLAARARRRAGRRGLFSASARCTCCFRTIGRARAPIIPPTGAFSIRSTSTCSTARPAARRGARGGSGGARSRHRRRLCGRNRRLPGSLGDQAGRARGAPSRLRAGARGAAGRSAVRRLSGFRRRGRRGAAALCHLPGDRLGRSRRGLAPLARERSGTANRRRSATPSPGDPLAFDFALFCQWLADRQLRAPRRRRAAAGLDIGFYRDLAVGAAPDGAEAWARAEELALGVSVGAPPDPFSIEGQNWNLPPPDPLAGARDGWADLSALYAANMRHAGMLRIDHAMGLPRLFVIPDGAKPAEGAYLAYPARRSHRPCRAREPARALHGRRRGPRHRARRASAAA